MVVVTVMTRRVVVVAQSVGLLYCNSFHDTSYVGSRCKRRSAEGVGQGTLDELVSVYLLFSRVDHHITSSVFHRQILAVRLKTQLCQARTVIDRGAH
jgi:hypothetical protein